MNFRRHLTSITLGITSVLFLGLAANFHDTFSSQTKDVIAMKNMAAGKITYAEMHTHPIQEDGENKAADITTPRQVRLEGWIEKTFGIKDEKSNNIINIAHEVGKEFEVDPKLILAIISVESGFDDTVKSHAGAIGLMQVVPKWHAERIKTLNIAKEAIRDPEANVRLGTLIFKDFLRLAKNNTARALQMYNGTLGDHSKRYSNKVFHRQRVIQGLID